MIGLYYKNGVMLASDTGACYGSIKMFKDCTRIEKINNSVLLGKHVYKYIITKTLKQKKSCEW